MFEWNSMRQRLTEELIVCSFQTEREYDEIECTNRLGIHEFCEVTLNLDKWLLENNADKYYKFNHIKGQVIQAQGVDNMHN